MTFNTSTIFTGSAGAGSQSEIIKHTFTGGDNPRSVYIQAGLHADEHPGMLVIQHLLAELEAIEQACGINGTITLIPFANPIGMMQNVLGFWTGRFNLANGENFNRNFPDLAEELEALHSNTEWVELSPALQLDSLLMPKAHEDVVSAAKRALLREAVKHDVILDLHCDTAAILHFYTNERYRGRAINLAAALGIEAVLLESFAGGGAFDEACTKGWQWLVDKGLEPAERIPFSVSVELRGQADVSDELAADDARRILSYLCTEGFINTEIAVTQPLHRDRIDIFPLEGAVHLPSPANGLVVWKKQLGDWVKKGECFGEIASLDGKAFGQRVPVYSPVDGRILVQPLTAMVRIGQRVALIAGKELQQDRKKGKLLLNF